MPVECLSDREITDVTMRLTPDGERIARQLAMTDEEGQDALMKALLGDEE